mgnify:CR=1 FL=1
MNPKFREPAVTAIATREIEKIGRYETDTVYVEKQSFHPDDWYLWSVAVDPGALFGMFVGIAAAVAGRAGGNAGPELFQVGHDLSIQVAAVLERILFRLVQGVMDDHCVLPISFFRKIMTCIMETPAAGHVPPPAVVPDQGWAARYASKS